MSSESALPAPSPPAPLALPYSPRDARREQLQKEHDEAVARLKRVRQYRFVLYGEIRRCLNVLGDLAIELIGEEQYRELRRESELLAPELAPPDGSESEEPTPDPALAWMEPDPPAEPLEPPPSLPPAPPSSEETSRAARTLRECLEYLDAADRSTPEFHLAILSAEERLRAFDETSRALVPAPSGKSAPAASGT